MACSGSRSAHTHGKNQCLPPPQGWLDDTAESLKSIDPNHLVTYDSEGFLGSSTPGPLLGI